MWLIEHEVIYKLSKSNKTHTRVVQPTNGLAINLLRGRALKKGVKKGGTGFSASCIIFESTGVFRLDDVDTKTTTTLVCI